MYTLTSSCYNKIVSHLHAQLPFEGCGIVAAKDDQMINYFFPIKNNHTSPLSHFQYEPQSWIDTLYQIEREGLTLVGFVHSHPTEEPHPSKNDWLGFDNDYFHLLGIVSFKQKDSPQMKWYQLSNTKQFIDYPLMLT